MNWTEVLAALNAVRHELPKYPPPSKKRYPRRDPPPPPADSYLIDPSLVDFAYAKWSVVKLIRERGRRITLFKDNKVLAAPNGLFIQDPYYKYPDYFPQDREGVAKIVETLFPYPCIDYEKGLVLCEKNEAFIYYVDPSGVAADEVRDLEDAEIRFDLEDGERLEEVLYPHLIQDRHAEIVHYSGKDKLYIAEIRRLSKQGFDRASIMALLKSTFKIELSEHRYRALRKAAHSDKHPIGRPGRPKKADR